MLSNKEKSIFAKIVEAFSFNVVSEMGEKNEWTVFCTRLWPINPIVAWTMWLLLSCTFKQCIPFASGTVSLNKNKAQWALSHKHTHTHTPSYVFILHRICNINKHVKYPTNSTYINWYWYNAVCVRFAAKRYEHALIMFEHTITHGIVCLIWHRIQLLCTVIES